MNRSRTRTAASPAAAGTSAADGSHRVPGGSRRPVRTGLVGAVIAGVAAIGTPASATHPHVIQTPGTCVDKAGAGFGTGQDHPLTDPTFHSQVHKGTPGLFAFEHANNPVSVVGGTLCP
jgi:hypothetical protein